MGVVWLTLFIVGLCLGSFINCVVFRLNHNLSPLRGRSICPGCKHQLSWLDNIPLLSFAFLGGRCRYCHKPISWQYPLVELVSGLVTVFVVFHLAGVEVVAPPPPRWPNGLLGGVIFNLLITYSLITIFVSDLLYGTIPDEIVGFGVLASLIFLIFQFPTILVTNLLTAATAAVCFFVLVLITRHKGMGMGDVKFVFFMGLILGFPLSVVALFLAFLTGALVGVILILVKKKRFGQTIPFGPFLCSATWIIIFWGEKILTRYLQWFLK